jgi:small subunit ribosomal protein S20
VASHKSAEKRNRQRPKRELRNRVALGSMRTALKKARIARDGKSADATALILQAVQKIDKAVTKGVVHRRTASRLISRLSRPSNTVA